LRIAVNQQETRPWWEAWSPALLAMAAAIVFVGLLLCWDLLATLYFFPAWLAAFLPIAI